MLSCYGDNIEETPGVRCYEGITLLIVTDDNIQETPSVSSMKLLWK